MFKHRSSVDVLSIVALSFLFLSPSVAAAAPSLSTSTTIASVASSTIPAITFAGGVNQVKATRTITVASVPIVPVTLTIGTCVVTVTGAGTSDTDCSNNTALIATTTDTTVNLIASRIRTFTGLSDTGHGALTIGGSNATTSFTTTGTETSATAITATLSSGTDFTLNTVNTTGIVGVASTVTVVIPSGIVATSTDHSVTIDGIVINLGNAALTANQVAAAIAAATFTSGTSYIADGSYVVTNPSAANLTFTKSATATLQNTPLVMADSKYGGTAQTNTFNFSGISNPYIYTITLNGKDYKATFLGGVLQSLVTDLATSLAADGSVACTTATNLITCSATNPGVTFTASASVVVVPSPAPALRSGSSRSSAQISVPAPAPKAPAPAPAPKDPAPAPAPAPAPKVSTPSAPASTSVGPKTSVSAPVVPTKTDVPAAPVFNGVTPAPSASQQTRVSAPSGVSSGSSVSASAAPTKTSVPLIFRKARSGVPIRVLVR